MADALYIEKGGKKLRCGFTTGSCAAAASKAALTMLITGDDIHYSEIVTPKGPVYNAEIVDIERGDGYVSCAVVKDGGDDPDVTTGAKICAKVCFTEGKDHVITGGEGVGIVTKNGLDQPANEYAINSVPRKMILQNIDEVLRKYNYKDRAVKIEISVPGGKEIAQKTFNPKLGIVGGISILGTTGIVEPMSDTAIVDTIKAEVSVRRAEGREVILFAPGNYGLVFLNEKYGIDENKAVMISNFVCDSIKIAADMGFKKLLFVGHIGKLVKVAGGIKNTHSRYGDHRMEILSELAGHYLPDEKAAEISEKLSKCVMTDEAVRILNEEGIGDAVFKEMALNISRNIELWSDDRIKAEIIVFSNENTELIRTDNALEFMEEI
ncbi:cobalt-precorrin-5B (C(1))-methyltransferase CbiD [Butyrivibrio sp. NC2002]|uniref:cobalt-precorrin-5B (C(1))-methyltransferase CbiD n=1 Tax=Butyrivibrio sp. NC2002 TaxID=1410610 RepID=UPI00056A200A|nr:cobalt-precorrin-5B (C(1))-methyltransferase CbiD [Butyrivibrio sp. NC2002]